MKHLTIVLFLFVSCGLISCAGKIQDKKLKVTKQYKLEVPEPSGLALSADGKSLWTVSDETAMVYQISLEGKILKSFSVDAYDLEGICVLSDTSIAVVAERTREVIMINNDGKEYYRKKILNDAVDNSGLEGITINKNNDHIFVVKEKHPRTLIELDNNLNELKKNKIDYVKDLSGLDFIPDKNELWMISDESKTISVCNIDGKAINKYRVKIDQIEGIAVDKNAGKLYLVSDKEETLYLLEIK